MRAGPRPQGLSLRRRWLLRAGAFVLPGWPAAAATAAGAATGATTEPAAEAAAASEAAEANGPWPIVEPGRPMRFPRDHGAHADFRTEWWYITGWLRAGDGEDLGMQLTFFRSRTRHSRDNPSRFSPTQLLFVHAAIASPSVGRLVHAERAARAGFGLASFSERDLEVAIDDWKLWRDADDRIHARIDGGAFGMDLLATPPGPPVLQGDRGFSRKGPLPAQASWYYSQPQLAVAGTIRGPGEAPSRAVTGNAWLDREWSTEYLDKRASGWDWCGLNFDDGSALMAFRIRLRDGGVLWSYANWIPAVGPAGRAVRVGSADSAVPAWPAPTPDPEFVPLRHWRSPRTDTRWPVAMQLRIGERRLELQPLFDDQELSAEESTGTIYWEGAVRVFEAGRQVGAGYMELTGYAGRVRM